MPPVLFCPPADPDHLQRLLPYVDFTSVGMYPWNPDEQTPDGRGADYVPTVDGHLDGAKSLQADYRYLKDRNRRIAGNVPVVVFIDWPNDMMTAYPNLPLSEKQDYRRIFGAEAYTDGLFRSNDLGRQTVGGGAANVSAGLLVQRDTRTRTVHLVNHNYNRGITPLNDDTVTVDRLTYYDILVL